MRSVLERLGFSPEDRVVIVHADDVGASHAANMGSFAVLEAGAASCGSILVPSPWFPEAAAYARSHPEADLGVHLTLTCEYTAYRWRAVSPATPGSSLHDEQGYLWRTSEAAQTHITAEEAEAELRAQIERALAFGIDVTHLDTHMGTVFHPKFMGAYVRLALEYQVPCFFPRVTQAMVAEIERFVKKGDDLIVKPSTGVAPHTFEPAATASPQVEAADVFRLIQAFMDRLESQGYPLVDHVVSDTLVDVEDKLSFYRQQFDSLRPGLTHLLLHPAMAGPELEAMGSRPRSRAQDYQVFTSPELKAHLALTGVHIVGYRRLRDLIRDV